MKSVSQSLLDKLSIGASTICAIHCAVLPILLAVFPALSFLPSENHEFHEALVILVVPMSLLAAYLGCSKHKDMRVLVGIGSGLVLLLVTALFGHDLVGETGEKAFTVLASIILAMSHWRNYKLCRARDCDSHGCHSA